MKKTLFILFTLICSSIATFSQNMSCEELMDYVEDEGYSEGTVGAFSLIMESSWLKEVKGYSVEGNIVIIAEIKTDDFGLSSKKYAFCGVPSSSWRSFKGTFTDSDMSYGEKFHKYIMDYKCNCY
jgi:hypothetical protein